MSILILYSLLSILAPRAASLSFSFNFSDPTVDPCREDLTCEGTAFHKPLMDLTARKYSTGRVSYAHPVRLWNSETGELASFATTFSFKISPYSAGYDLGDGVAFFLGHYPSSIPNNSWGGNLGLMDLSNNKNPMGDSRIVAVEFDTLGNMDFTDIIGSDHIGIDVNSIVSVATTNVSSLRTGDVMTASISYDNTTKLLAADLRINGTLYHVNASVDLRRNLPEEVAVGFSAATGEAVEVNEILSWTFNSTLKDKRASQPPLARVKLLTAVLVPVMFSMVVFCAFLGSRLWRRHARRAASVTDGEPEEEQDEAEFEKGVGPKRYGYRQLVDATSNFADDKKLGRGGFGNVYKGQLSDQDRAVAIKMLSSESSSQGRKEFEAEVKIISRLRHRNLVQLLGWCDSCKGLLLVYEFVTEGCLDRHIHSTDRWLTWPERYNIILGLGSALRYLHDELEQYVVHGDIKPSNIMLDSSCNAKLGDFGLARLVDPATAPHTTHVVHGTRGYIDPEFISTQRPSIESDVYSFGIVLLEIVSGRRPVVKAQSDDEVSMLLQWVWNLCGKNAILDAVDERLRGDEMDERQMLRVLVVGLWCAQLDRSERPSIAQAMHVLTRLEVPLPALPPHMYNNERNQLICSTLFTS